MPWINAPCCEACWIAREATFDAIGNLTGIRRPVRLIDPDVEWCQFCQCPTIVGIYVRTEIPQPTTTESEETWTETPSTSTG